MKHLLISIVQKNQLKLFVFLLALALATPIIINAQKDSSQNVEKVASEEKEMLSPSLELIVVQKGDNSIDLKATIQTKIKKVIYKLPLLKIHFYQITGTEEKELGFVITDRIGKAVFTCKPNSITTNAEGTINFKAVFTGIKSIDPTDVEVTIKRARLELIAAKEDSLNMVHLKLLDVGSGKEIPIAKTDLGIFVKRLFKPMKIADATTDESGEATVEISNKLPGNAKGDIILMALLSENEIYGNLETSTTIKWGTPVSDVLQISPRALWSAHPPMWMMITFAVLMTVVWGHYIVIIFELFRLRKEEPHPIKS